MHNEQSKSGPFKLTYIIGTYPLLTTTFIDREVSLLQQWGVAVQVLSLRRPGGLLSPEQQAMQRHVTYLLPIALLPFVAGQLWFALLRPRAYWGTLAYLFSRPHPSLKSRLKTLLHFAEGVCAAHRLRHNPGNQLHAHFIDRAATVALVVSRLLGVPYSVTAHANDIYVNPILLPEKLSQASFVATCTGYNQRHLSAQGEGLFNHKLSCIYHGLDVGQYQPAEPAPESELILAVGQLKEKKGFTYLLQACRQLLDQGHHLRCEIVGEGPLRPTLEAEIERLGLAESVILCGALPHGEVIAKYRQAAIFTLPSVLSADGDRDGIPNVVLEAMAMQLPVVSTRHSGIPEVVIDGETGLLIPPAKVDALAGALAQLLANPALRRQLGRRGRQFVMEHFDLEQNIQRLFDGMVGSREAREQGAEVQGRTGARNTQLAIRNSQFSQGE